MLLKQLVYKKGQSLVEVVIALAIAILIITGLISATSSAMKNAQFGKNHELALKLAQEGMEWVRSQRDQITWSEFTAKSGATSWCLHDLALSWGSLVTKANCEANNSKLNTIFSRSMDINTNIDNCIPLTPVPTNSPSYLAAKVVINVSWTDAAGSHKSEQTSCFTNWQKK